jgi:hypothetical protein
MPPRVNFFQYHTLCHQINEGPPLSQRGFPLLSHRVRSAMIGGPGQLRLGKTLVMAPPEVDITFGTLCIAVFPAGR